MNSRKKIQINGDPAHLTINGKPELLDQTRSDTNKKASKVSVRH